MTFTVPFTVPNTGAAAKTSKNNAPFGVELLMAVYGFLEYGFWSTGFDIRAYKLQYSVHLLLQSHFLDPGTRKMEPKSQDAATAAIH